MKSRTEAAREAYELALTADRFADLCQVPEAVITIDGNRIGMQLPEAHKIWTAVMEGRSKGPVIDREWLNSYLDDDKCDCIERCEDNDCPTRQLIFIIPRSVYNPWDD